MGGADHKAAFSRVVAARSPGKDERPTADQIVPVTGGSPISARTLYPIEVACGHRHRRGEVGELVAGQGHCDGCPFHGKDDADEDLARWIDARLERRRARIERGEAVFPLTGNLCQQPQGEGLGGAYAQDEADMLPVFSRRPGCDTTLVFFHCGCAIVGKHADTHADGHNPIEASRQ